MPLEMILATTYGKCDVCGEDEWLFFQEGKLVCDYCLQAIEFNEEVQNGCREEDE